MRIRLIPTIQNSELQETIKLINKDPNIKLHTIPIINPIVENDSIYLDIMWELYIGDNVFTVSLELE